MAERLWTLLRTAVRLTMSISVPTYSGWPLIFRRLPDTLQADSTRLPAILCSSTSKVLQARR